MNHVHVCFGPSMRNKNRCIIVQIYTPVNASSILSSVYNAVTAKRPHTTLSSYYHRSGRRSSPHRAVSAPAVYRHTHSTLPDWRHHHVKSFADVTRTFVASGKLSKNVKMWSAWQWSWQSQGHTIWVYLLLNFCSEAMHFMLWMVWCDFLHWSIFKLYPRERMVFWRIDVTDNLMLFGRHWHCQKWSRINDVSSELIFCHTAIFLGICTSLPQPNLRFISAGHLFTLLTFCAIKQQRRTHDKNFVFDQWRWITLLNCQALICCALPSIVKHYTSWSRDHMKLVGRAHF